MHGAELSAPIIGQQVRAERDRRGMTLEQLGAAANVSASMLSAIERGVKVPTVLVLDRVATAMGTSIARLLGDEREERVIVLRHDEQDVVMAEGWTRRILSPVLPGVEFELMRTTLEPGVDAGVFAAHAPGSREYVAVEVGRLRLTLDGDEHLLAAGDAIYYAGDCRHAFANASRTQLCEYVLAMELGGARRGHHRVDEAPES